MSVAVTGSRGYLGSAVRHHLRSVGTPYQAGLGRLEGLAPGSVRCRAVIHCAGALRSRPAHEIWHANAAVLAPLLRAIGPDPVVVLASSRAVTAPPDQQDVYGLSKRAAEQAAALHPGPLRIIRMTVLAGPSPAGLGGSFVSRMTDAALRTGTISIPSHDHRVDFLDVREASAVMAAVTDPSLAWPGQGPIDATSGPLDLAALAHAIAQAVRETTGRRIRLTRTCLPSSRHPPPADPAQWAALCAHAGVTPRPSLSTIRDTVHAHVTAREKSNDRD
ncbi:NAD-dependent epimerase/dehydratase family protein [Streptomyces sp. NPDC058694]|uniref:NAD-dependent epimerase/dehydratase family protein n=1 Tax=Streptomyces sp. NPDC058694 TaxID=3346603 RepID=UPI00365FEC0B